MRRRLPSWALVSARRWRGLWSASLPGWVLSLVLRTQYRALADGYFAVFTLKDGTYAGNTHPRKEPTMASQRMSKSSSWIHAVDSLAAWGEEPVMSQSTFMASKVEPVH